MIDKPLLGELLIKEKVIGQDTVDEALRLQIGGNRRLGHILVQMKAINADQLAETLASQLKTPITDIGGAFSENARRAIPRYLCRQYGALPLAYKQNNILEVAMANPADEEAVNDLEHYTGNVIEPRLARHSDIEREISRRVPLGLNDFFTPQSNTLMTRTISVIALVAVLGLGAYTYDNIKTAREGNVSISSDLVLYHNHDLTLAVDRQGGYSLQGHGAFADGLYQASFPDLQYLEQFVTQHKGEFSGQQRTWLTWAIQQAGDGKNKLFIAQN